jgi:CubicO group peptidase (beta-lactamase class C family)
MKPFTRYLQLLLVILAPYTLAQDEAPASADWLEAVEQVLERELAFYNVPGAAVAIVQGDDIIYAEGFGVRNLESREPVTLETLFRIGSTTKSMTSLMVATFVDEGLLDWDTPVTTYAVDFELPTPELTARITVGEMMGMGTGLADGVNPIYFGEYRAEEIWDHLKDSEILGDSAPGEIFYYNNHMYAATGYLVPKVQGAPAETLLDAYRRDMQTRIFDPIGMTSAAITDEPATESDNYALPYETSLTGELRPIANQRIGAIAPAGGVTTNVLDMARYLATQLHDGVAPDGTRVASSEQVERTHTVQTQTGDNPNLPGEQLGYAMGWGVTDYRGHQLIHHAGGVNGYRSEIMLVPEADLAVVVLTNSYFGSYFATAALFAVVDKYFGYGGETLDEIRAGYENRLAQRAQLRESIVSTLDPEALTPFLGDYEKGWQLVLEEDGLWLLNEDWDFALLPAEDSAYLTGSGGDLVGLTVRIEEGVDGVGSITIDDLDTIQKQQ